MTTGSANFKSLGSECEIYVRQLSPSRHESRLISSIRKIARASAGFTVELDYTFQVHTLVELDVKFPGQPYYYRSRGVVEWQAPSGNPEKPHRLGIRVLGMEKLDPTGVPMTPPKTQRRPAIAPQGSKKKQSSTQQVVPETLETPQEAPIHAPATAASPAAETTGPRVPTTELKIPKAREVSEILTSLIGEKIEVSKIVSEMDIDDIAVVGAYKGENERILSVVGTDISLANWLGAALAMIPREVAKKDIEVMGISEETRENTQEIFNINTSTLNGPGLPHHKFTKLYYCFDDEHPPEVRALMTSPIARIDFTVEVPGYGTGRLCYLFAEWHSEEGDNAVPADEPVASLSPSPEFGGDAADSGSDESGDSSSPAPEEPSAAPEEPVAETGPAYTINPPKAKDIAELFTNLVGEAVGVEKLKNAPLDEDEFAVIGNYLSDDDQIIALCAMDIRLANWTAAALAMIPKDVVKLDIDNWKLSEESRENVQEIMNIAGSIFNKPGMPHLRFDTLLVTMDADPPASYRPILSSEVERVDFSIKIPGYGDGVMACMFKAP